MYLALALMAPTLGAFPQELAAEPAAPSKGRGPAFAAPVMLMADGAPINGDDVLLYPSPVLLDVDGDGAVELVLGDLWGKVFVHERVPAESGIVWGPRRNATGADGAHIQLPNW